MGRLLRSIRQFLSELRRRNVYQVVATYIVVGFFVIEAADLTLTRLGLPPWTVTLVIVLVGLGFPIALVMAWALEVTPEGVQVEKTATEEADISGEEVPPSVSPTRDLWVGASVLAVLLLGVWWLFPVFSGGTGEEAAKKPATKTAASADTARAASRDRPFVAVLPLENLSPEAENQFFADGIHEEILSQLSKVSGLGVFPRTTMGQYADTEKSVSEIASELGAQAVLEGSVRRAAGRVRITVQLIDPERRDHLWSNTYERPLSPKQIFDVQAEIAGKVASALETELTEAEQRRIAEAPTTDLDAYDAYLKGRSAANEVWIQVDTSRIAPAVRHLREAVGRDSSFAEAYARLGFAYHTRALFSGKTRWKDSAFAAVDRASALDPELADAHAVNGFIHQLDSARAAEESYRRALQLDPNNRLAADGMADLAMYKDNYADAVRWAHRTVRADPRWEYGLTLMGATLQFVGLEDAAAAWYRRVLEMNPENILAVQVWTLLCLSQGKGEKAREIVTSYRSTHPDHPTGIQLAATVALHLDRPNEARRLLQTPGAQQGGQMESLLDAELLLGLAELRAGNREAGRAHLRAAVDSVRGSPDDGDVTVFETGYLWIARGLAALGREDQGLVHLRRAMQNGELRHTLLRRDPFFKNLRPDPRFQEILGRMEEKQREFREKVRAMNIDLYPPGVDPRSINGQTSADE